MIYFVFTFLSVIGALALYNFLRAKTKMLRLMMINIITSLLVFSTLYIVVLDKSKACFIDVAFMYLLTSFIFNIAVMKFFEEEC